MRGWIECDPCNFIGRAIRWHSEYYDQDKACLYRAISVPHHLVTRIRIARPSDRWEKVSGALVGVLAKCRARDVRAFE